MGIFLGVYGVFQDLAIPLGKEINGILSEIPIDLKETDMEPKDRRFVAAWWLAFLILGTGTAVFSFPLILFPRKLVSKRKQKEALAKALVTFAGGQVEDEDAKRPEVDQANDYDTIKPPAIVVTSEMNQKEGSYRRYSLPQSDRVRKLSLQPDSVSGSRKSSLQLPGEGRTERKVSITGDMVFEQPVKLGKDGLLKEQSVIELIKDFPKAMLRVLKIPAFTLILLDIAIIAIPTSGTMMFKSMYMANEYNVKMSEVAMASGVSTAVGNIGGTILSSAISSRLHTKVGYVWLILGTYAFMTAIAPLAIVFGCDNVGVYGAQGDIGVFQNISSLSCDCSEVGQLISCGDDGRNYYSPCYAGCSGVDGKEFTDCSLLANGTTGRVTPGLCDVDCHDNFIVYTFIHGAQFMANSMGNIPKKLLVMRIVQPQDRGFGTSMFMFFYYLVSVPSPNVFGKVIDGTCLIWDDGYCSLYDRNSIRNFMAGVDAGVQGTVLISMFAMLAIFYYELKKTKAKSQQPDKDMNVKDAEMDVPEPIRNKEPQFESVRL